MKEQQDSIELEDAQVHGGIIESLTEEIKKSISEKAKALKEKHKVPFIYVYVSPRHGDMKNPLIAFFKPPTTLSEMSKFYYDAQSDPIVGNLKLARKLFLDGDKELVDNEFEYMHSGLMGFVPNLLPQAAGEFKTF